MCSHRTHYNYHALDKLLTEDSDPVELGHQLDEIMQALTAHATRDGGYHAMLEGDYYVLRILREIFWKLKPISHEHRDTTSRTQ